MTYKPCMITWRDACACNGYDAKGLLDIISYGAKVDEDEECITLAQDYFPKEDSYRTSISIPKVNITSITYLRKGQ